MEQQPINAAKWVRRLAGHGQDTWDAMCELAEDLELLQRLERATSGRLFQLAEEKAAELER